MFGYVTICEPELKMKDWRKYRSYYCGLCRTLKERHGNVGQLTLTYDMTFAVILLTSLYEVKGLTSSHRCKTHPVKKQWMIQNEITEYCADMNVLLAYYHMIDNWQDEKKVSGLLASKTLHGKAKKIEKKYKRQSQVIRRELKKLAEYEKENCQNIDLPAGCFGRLMEELLVYKEDIWEPTLRKVGFFLGKYCVNSFCATLHISPFSLNKMHLLLVVPASNAIIYFPIFFLLFYLIRSFQSILYYNVLHKKRPACFHAGLSLITDSHRVIYSYFSSSP